MVTITVLVFLLMNGTATPLAVTALVASAITFAMQFHLVVHDDH